MEFEKAVRSLRSCSLEKMTQNDFERWGLTGMKLHEHQLEGVKWLAERHDAAHGCILGDEMGLGKTLQVIESKASHDLEIKPTSSPQSVSLLLYLMGVKHLSGPFLIVCPLSVVSGWEEELARSVCLQVLNVSKIK